MENIVIFAKALLDFLKEYGLTGALIILLILIIQDPYRAARINTLIWRLIFSIFRWGSKQHIASEVGSATNIYLNKHIRKMLPSIPETKVRIKWVTSPDDPVLTHDGTLILRLQETNDQTRNILAATRVALSMVVCPSLRSNIQMYASSAVDLTLLRGLADLLGKHAQPVFYRYFLSPEIADDQRAAILFEKLVRLDQAGMFVSILLEELRLLGETLFSTGDTSDKTESLVALVEYLLSLATRPPGQKIDLEYISPDFRIGILLLAISWKANTEGLPPYVRRIDQKIKLGCDSIYVIAFPNARDFLTRIVEVLRSESRLMLAKCIPLESSSVSRPSTTEFGGIALFRRNTLFDHATFKETVAELRLVADTMLEGTVLDVSTDTALIDIQGLHGVLTRTGASWSAITDLSHILKPGEKRSFLLKVIDTQRDQLDLSLRTPETNPWLQAPIPHVGDQLEVYALSIKEDSLICRTDAGIEIVIPHEELSWLPATSEEVKALVSKRHHVVIVARNDFSQSISASIRRLDKNPWPKIQRQMPRGTILTGKVVQVSADIVRVELPGGLRASIPGGAMLKAGHEYAHFTETVVVGQGLEVVVMGVSTAKRRIRLDLARNAPPKPRPA